MYSGCSLEKKQPVLRIFVTLRVKSEVKSDCFFLRDLKTI